MNRSRIKNRINLLDTKLFLFLLYLILAPFYVFPSGLPQFSDYLMTILIFLVLFDKKGTITKQYTPIFLLLLLFVYYITMVNVIWVGITEDVEFLKTSIFYIYNCLVFIIVLKMYAIYKEKLLAIILYGIVISASIELFVLLFKYQMVYRSVGSFNNPNQLGYFAVISVSIFSVITKNLKYNFLFEIVIVLIFLFIVILSLSKAALVAVLFNVLFVFLKDIRYAFLLFIIFTIVFLSTDLNHPIAKRLDTRISTFGIQQDDNLVGRAYDRIWKNPEYLIFGAGEGLMKRFTKNGINMEIHSSLGSILFSYGIVGLSLFLFFIFLIYKHSTIKYFVFLFPSFLYGMTHHGLRFTIFWILLAILVVKGNKYANQKGRYIKVR